MPDPQILLAYCRDMTSQGIPLHAALEMASKETMIPVARLRELLRGTGKGPPR